MENKGTQITITFQLSSDNYIGIIDMAGYGVGYWASRMESTSEGCHFTDADTEEEFFITPADVERAIAALFAKGSMNNYYQSAIRNLVVDGCGGDVGSDIADAIIQQACFGRVIYG